MPYLILNRDTVSRPPATAAPVATVDNAAIQQQLTEAAELSAKLSDQPLLLGTIVTLYRDIINQQPQHGEALAALQQLQQQCVAMIVDYAEREQYQLALQIADESLGYFPDLANNGPLRALLTIIRKIESTAPTLPAAESVAEPPAPTAEQPSSSDPVPGSAQTPGATTVVTTTNSQQAIIDHLLRQAQQLRQRGALFAGKNSAAARYQSVLALQPDEPNATAGLAQLLSVQIASIEQSIAVGGLEIARAALTEPLRRFPEHPDLKRLSAQLDSLRQPSISAVTVFNITDQADAGDSDGHTLMVNFGYRQFTGDNTIVTIQLHNPLQSTPIAEMPIIVQGQQGTKNVPVHIAAVVDNLDAATYQLNFILNGNTVATHEFSPEL